MAYVSRPEGGAVLHPAFARPKRNQSDIRILFDPALTKKPESLRTRSMSTSERSFHVWDCERMLQLRCPGSWGKLDPTPEADVRHCRECDRDVYLCRTPADFIAHGERGRCVAIPDDLSSRLGMGLGQSLARGGAL